MYKNIMLAIDGSDVSNSAIEEVVKLAKNEEINLRIVYVVDENIVYSGSPSFDYASLIAVLKEEGQDILDKAARTIEKEPTIKIVKSLLELKTLKERVAEVIVKDAKKWKADLLVIGTHGRRGLSRLFIGSVAESIIRIATTPVLLVRGS